MSKLLSTIFCVLAIFSQSVFSQEKQNVEQIFVGENVDCEILLSILDSVNYVTRNDPNLLGYIVISGGKNPIDNLFYLDFIKNYVSTREMKQRIFFKFIESKKDKVETKFFTGKIDNFFEDAVSNPDLKISFDNQKVEFAGDLLESVLIDGKQKYIQLSSACSIENIDYSILSKIVTANPKLKAYTIIKGGSLEQRNDIKNSYLKDAAKYDMNSDRFKIFDGGKNKVNDNKFFEIKVYLSDREVKSAKFFN